MRVVYGRKLYYHDECNDDFVNIRLDRSQPIKGYTYTYRNPVMRVLSFLLYYLVAVPVIAILGVLLFGAKIKGRRYKRGIKGGFMVYSNHVHMLEFLATFVYFSVPRRTFILCDPDPFRMPVVKHLSKMLGGMALPADMQGMRDMVSAINYRLKQGNVVMVMPEAHIWPYYTGIRPFSHKSFTYAVKANVPVIPAVTTFRAPRGPFKRFLRPRISITYGPAVYPPQDMPLQKSAETVRDQVYAFMVNTAESARSPKLYDYVWVDHPVDTKPQIGQYKRKK